MSDRWFCKKIPVIFHLKKNALPPLYLIVSALASFSAASAPLLRRSSPAQLAPPLLRHPCRMIRHSLVTLLLAD
jgi:hypothetical protein